MRMPWSKPESESTHHYPPPNDLPPMTIGKSAPAPPSAPPVPDNAFLDRMRAMPVEERNEFAKRFNEATPEQIRGALDANKIARAIQEGFGQLSAEICADMNVQEPDGDMVSGFKLIANAIERTYLKQAKTVGLNELRAELTQAFTVALNEQRDALQHLLQDSREHFDTLDRVRQKLYLEKTTAIETRVKHIEDKLEQIVAMLFEKIPEKPALQISSDLPDVRAQFDEMIDHKRKFKVIVEREPEHLVPLPAVGKRSNPR